MSVLQSRLAKLEARQRREHPPEKAPSPEAWAADVQRYYRDKAASHEP
jgi:hypothetical protein